MIAWFRQHRTSVRLAFGLRLFTMIAGAGLSVAWMRLLADELGDELYGRFIAFNAFVNLTGLSELGIGGAMAILAGQYLGAQRSDELKKWLANARSVFLILAVAAPLVCATVAFMPALLTQLNFTPIAGSGSMTLLFICGAVGLFFSILVSYFNNLNYAYGTITWPILPQFILLQICLCSQWLLARQQAPLYVIYATTVVMGVIGVALSWSYLRASHEWLGNLRPVQFNPAIVRQLLTLTWWGFLCTMGNVIFTSTDRLLINAGFGPELVTPYQMNYKTCEMAILVAFMLSGLLLPKLTMQLASADPALRTEAVANFKKLNRLQNFWGCSAALGYLWLNDLFVGFCFGETRRAPLLWQFAFACTLAVTACGDSGIQVATRCGTRGIRIAGGAIVGTALLNLVLSYIAMRSQHIAGIAFATVLAQTVLVIWLGKFSHAQLGLPCVPYLLKSLALPLATTGIFYLALLRWSASSPVIWILFAALVGLSAKVIGINRQFFAAELQQFRRFLPG